MPVRRISIRRAYMCDKLTHCLPSELSIALDVVECTGYLHLRVRIKVTGKGKD